MLVDVRQSDEFAEWLENLIDARARRRIAQRVDRLTGGLFGDTKSVGGGLMELRIDYGPGYRVYYIRQGREIVVLLCRGDKSSQTRDIARANELAMRWKDM